MKRKMRQTLREAEGSALKASTFSAKGNGTTKGSVSKEEAFIAHLSEQICGSPAAAELRGSKERVQTLLLKTFADLPTSALRTRLIHNVDSHVETVLQHLITATTATATGKKRSAPQEEAQSQQQKEDSTKKPRVSQATVSNASCWTSDGLKALLSRLRTDLSSLSTARRVNTYEGLLLCSTTWPFSLESYLQEWFPTASATSTSSPVEALDRAKQFQTISKTLAGITFASVTETEIVPQLLVYSQLILNFTKALSLLPDNALLEVLQTVTSFLSLCTLRLDLSSSSPSSFSLNQAIQERWNSSSSSSSIPCETLLDRLLAQYVELFSLFGTEYSLKKYFGEMGLPTVLNLTANADPKRIFNLVATCYTSILPRGNANKQKQKEEQEDESKKKKRKAQNLEWVIHKLFHFFFVEEEKGLQPPFKAMLSNTTNYLYFIYALKRCSNYFQTNMNALIASASSLRSSHPRSSRQQTERLEELDTMLRGLRNVGSSVAVPPHFQRWINTKPLSAYSSASSVAHKKNKKRSSEAIVTWLLSDQVGEEQVLEMMRAYAHEQKMESIASSSSTPKTNRNANNEEAEKENDKQLHKDEQQGNEMDVPLFVVDTRGSDVVRKRDQKQRRQEATAEENSEVSELQSKLGDLIKEFDEEEERFYRRMQQQQTGSGSSEEEEEEEEEDEDSGDE